MVVEMSDSVLKTGFPFILGTTSYIIPDDIIPNVRKLAPQVDDFELVLFESEPLSNLPSKKDIIELRNIAESYGSGFTVHLPTDRKAASSEESERQAFIDAARRVIDLTLPLSPRGWILHLEGLGRQPAPEEIFRWTTWGGECIEKMVSETGDPRLIALENLAYPFSCNTGLVLDFNTSYCLDIGHLWMLNNVSWESICRDAMARTSIIHMHGVFRGTDHISLRQGDRALQKIFLDIVRDCGYSGVMTLEVFNETDYLESAAVIDELWDK
jgi:sugar phosphate isomerase/epimerase